MTAAALPEARQWTQKDGRTYRDAVCPGHRRKSRRFRHPTSEGWVFECEGPPNHNFTAAPDPSAPRTVAEAQAVIERARQGNQPTH